MADESNLAVSPGRALRWGVFGLLTLAAVGLYFAYGRHIPPFGPQGADRAVTTR